MDLFAAEDHEGSVLSDERRVINGRSQNRAEIGQLPARSGGKDDAGLTQPGDDLVEPGRNATVTIDKGPVHVCDDEAEIDLGG